MMIASSSFDVPLVAGLLILAVLGVALYVIFSLIEGRVTGWAHRRDEFDGLTVLLQPQERYMPLLRILGTLSVICVLSLSGSRAGAEFVLRWIGNIRASLLCSAAQEKGYFKAEGLDVDIDQGTGSAATVTRIASGTYDAGFGDMERIIQLAGTKPGEQPWSWCI